MLGNGARKVRRREASQVSAFLRRHHWQRTAQHSGAAGSSARGESARGLLPAHPRQPAAAGCTRGASQPAVTAAAHGLLPAATRPAVCCPLPGCRAAAAGPHAAAEQQMYGRPHLRQRQRRHGWMDGGTRAAVGPAVWQARRHAPPGRGNAWDRITLPPLAVPERVSAGVDSREGYRGRSRLLAEGSAPRSAPVNGAALRAKAPL